MNAAQILKALGPIDVQSVRRDALLRWMVFVPLVMGLGVRWIIPWLAAQVLARFGFDLAPYYPLLMSMIAAALPMMFGMIVGFLLLDQRDDRTLSALQVTPLTLGGYLAYRISLPVLLTFLLTPVVFLLAGLVRVTPVLLLLVTLGTSLLGPVYALALAAFAENKVQGFALTKGAGVVFVPSLVAYFVPPAWQWLCGLVPTYWPMKLFWVLQGGGPHAWVYLLVGLVYQVLLLVFLVRRFERIMTR